MTQSLKFAGSEARSSAPVARQSVSEEVADHIRRLVFLGELQDGERVPQREIAAALGVSSVPVREALAGLQSEGVVTVEPNRGAFVNGLTAEIVKEQFFIFGRIYGLAVRKTAERADKELTRALTEMAERIRTASDSGALLRASIEFQMQIVAVGGSKRLLALFVPFSRMVPGNFYITIPGSGELTQRHTSVIVEKIALGRPAGAEKATWQLVDEIGDLVAERFE